MVKKLSRTGWIILLMIIGMGVIRKVFSVDGKVANVMNTVASVLGGVWIVVTWVKIYFQIRGMDSVQEARLKSFIPLMIGAFVFGVFICVFRLFFAK